MMQFLIHQFGAQIVITYDASVLQEFSKTDSLQGKGIEREEDLMMLRKQNGI